MKRALIVSNSAGLVTLFLKNDVELLVQNGYSIDVACNINYQDSNTEEFFTKYCEKIYDVPFPIRKLNPKSLLDSYKEISKLLKNNEYELVHCHSTIAAAVARQCTKKYREKGMKVVYTSHGFPFYEGNEGKNAKLFRAIENYFSKYTDAIITICNEDYENAKKMKCKNVKIMHGVGVDINRFISTSINKKEYRKKLGFNNTDKVILSIGEINTNKNHKVVIEAINRIGDSKIVYAICGREVTEIGKKKKLSELAEQLNVRIKFLGFRKDIPEVCYSSDIGALPSFKEGLGLSGIEMLATGLPVVGSNRQGIKDYVIDGVTGYLANPEDSESFSVAIKKSFELIKKEETKEECVRKSKEFNTDQARKVIDSVYREIGVYVE